MDCMNLEEVKSSDRSIREINIILNGLFVELKLWHNYGDIRRDLKKKKLQVPVVKAE